MRNPDRRPSEHTVAVLNQTGKAALTSGQFEQGLRLLRESLELQPEQPLLRLGIGAALLDQQRASEALVHLDEAVRLKPRFPEAIYNRANALLHLGRFQEAVAQYNQAIALKPAFTWAYINRGHALLALGRAERALESFDQAVRLEPRLAAIHGKRGEALFAMRRLDEALAAYQRALRLIADPDDPSAGGFHHLSGLVLLEMKHTAEAASAFAHALRTRPNDVTLLSNCGLVLVRLGQATEALAVLQRGLQLDPQSPELHNNYGNALIHLDRVSEAVLHYQEAVRLRPEFTDAVHNCACALDQLDRYAEAADYFDRFLALRPQSPEGLARRFLIRRRSGDWSEFERHRARIVRAVARGASADLPFSLLSVSAEAGLQLSCARTYMSQEASAMGRLCPDTPYGHERLRVGYLSGDLRDHAVAYLISGVIEQHDRKGFEPYALSLRPPDQSRYGQRIASSVTEFLDLSRSSDAQAASLIRAREIDILIDLSGYTQGSRSAILAHRPAPLQVNYLGFPATMGAPYIDYLIADEYLIPEASRLHYAEQIVYLPECFQANDDRRAFPTTTSRAQLGLPEEGLILCCFNNSYKINPTIFSIWMRLLQRHEHCYLWLVAGSDLVQQNLRREASARAVAPQRLLFAPRVPYEQHLARLGAADLFLDTLPFNGGTTVSDALWAGLPVLSCSGEALASRMAGSLLRTVALSELIACDLSDYERRADQLIGSPAELSGLRARLLASRHSSPLFNTERFTRHLEQALIAMHENFRSQRPTQHLFIPPLP